MVPRGSTPLSSGSNHPGWYKARPERRQGDDRQVEGEKVSSHHLPSGKISGARIMLENLIFLITGVSHGQGCWSSQVSGVFRPHSEGSQDSFRRGYQSCSMSCSCDPEKFNEKVLPDYVKCRDRDHPGDGIQAEGWVITPF